LRPTVTTSPPDGRGAAPSPLGRCTIVGLVATICGCSNLGPIDRSIQDIIDARSAKLGSVPPRERVWGDPRKNAEQYDTELQTTNPPASDLTYVPADPNRDPGAMLAAFAREAAGAEPEREVRRLTLADIWEISQTSSRTYLNAEEDYIFSAISLLIERHEWGPRFFDDVSATLDGDLDDGSNQAAVNVVNDLRVTQRLPYGGNVEAAWIWRATEQLREQTTGRYRQSSEIVLSGNLPLLRGAGMVAREDLIQSERNLIYAAREFERFRREFFVDIASDYFSLLEQQASISNQKRRLVSLYLQFEETQAKHERGLLPLTDVNNAQNALLETKSNLDNARDSYITSLDRFKIRLGIPVDDFIDVVPIAFDLTEPAISLREATARALALRLDLQNERDQVDDTRRGVAIAKNQILPNLDLNASVRLPTDPDEDEGGVAFDPDETDYLVGVTFGLPLDRKQERLRLRQAIIQYERSLRNLDAFEDNVILDARASRRRVEQARADLTLAEERVRITEIRKLEQTLKPDTTTTQERLDTENDLIEAKNARDRAETELRISILEYLLQTGQLRVGSDGQFQPIPGMEFPPATLFSELDDLADWWKNPLLGCYADFNEDSVIDTVDIDAFIQAWVAFDPQADCDTNGVFDVRDVVCFWLAYNGDCE